MGKFLCLTQNQQNDIIVLRATDGMIPKFRRDGRLPQGVHTAAWPEFQARFGQTETRKRLCSGLLEALRLLQAAGCCLAYVDGSFVSAKSEPGDFDVCWDIAGVDADLVPPVFFDFQAGRVRQKTQFGGEFFPAQLPEGLSGKTFLEFFQRDRDGRPKGIVALDLESFS